ncbi:MAG: hypothetical protein JXX29_05395 [Deltaproteobacteria bacterium]|nr:hypothetical protein [Deltaproteobacteria bacterium]MBN2671083.1 hypothetical protein [Deltaproteobacteria bacterium]
MNNIKWFVIMRLLMWGCLLWMPGAGCSSSVDDQEMEIPNGTEASAIPLTVDISLQGEVGAGGVAYYTITPSESGSFGIYLAAENDANLWFSITSDAVAFDATCGYEEATCSDSVTCGSDQRYCTYSLAANTEYVIAVYNIERVSQGGGMKTYTSSIDASFMLLVSAMGGEGTLDTPTPLPESITLETECAAWNFSYYSFTPSQIGYAITITNLSTIPDQGVAIRVGTEEQMTEENGWSCILDGNGSCPISVPPNVSQIIRVSIQHNGDPGAETIAYGLTLEPRSGMGTPGESEALVPDTPIQGTLAAVEGNSTYEQPDVYFTVNSVNHYAVVEPSVSGTYGFILDAPNRVSMDVAPIGGMWPDDIIVGEECPLPDAGVYSEARIYGVYLDFVFERPHLARIFSTGEEAEYSLTMLLPPTEENPIPIVLDTPATVIGIPNTTEQYFMFTAPKDAAYTVDTGMSNVTVSTSNGNVDENGVFGFTAVATEEVLLRISYDATCWPAFQLTVHEVESSK